MKKPNVAPGVLFLLIGTVAWGGTVVTPAITTTTGAGTNTETKAYIGLNWTLGGGPTPALVLGVFNTKVKANGDTIGANLAFHANLAGGLKPGKLKLSYLNGRDDLQGELGLGYDFVKAAPLGFLGLNAPYVSAGIDGYLNPGFVPYAGLHTQGSFDRPTGTTYSCPPGGTTYTYTLDVTTNMCNPISLITQNGQ